MKHKKHLPLIIGCMLFAFAVITLLYPTISNVINEINNNSTIQNYNNNVDTLSKTEKEKYLAEAQAYNDKLNNNVTDAFSKEAYSNTESSYDDILNFGNGQIGSIEIPKINVNLPIYHGSDETVLSKGAVHLANTSLPIGGKNTHSVISAHTAYPNQVLFDNITKLEKGDLFYIRVLDETLAYKVSSINIVNPDDTSKLQIVSDKDLVTLVTCYPYSVNTHRLLVTGERVNYDTKKSLSAKDEITQSNYYTSIFICVIIGIVLIIVLLLIKQCVPWRDRKENDV